MSLQQNQFKNFHLLLESNDNQQNSQKVETLFPEIVFNLNEKQMALSENKDPQNYIEHPRKPEKTNEKHTFTFFTEKTNDDSNQSQPYSSLSSIPELQPLTIFKSIYFEITSSYLNKIMGQNPLLTKKKITLNGCESFNDLQLEIFMHQENIISSIQQIIQRNVLILSQQPKKTLFQLVKSHTLFRSFLLETHLISSTPTLKQINDQLFFLLCSVVEKIQPLMLSNGKILIEDVETSHSDQAAESPVAEDNQKKDRNYLCHRQNIQTMRKYQQLMKLHLQNIEFTTLISKNQQIKYLNFKENFSQKVNETVRNKEFPKFIKLYSHLIIKLLNFQQFQKKLTELHNKEFFRPIETNILGSFFKAGIPRSFSSITSINLSNLTQTRVYCAQESSSQMQHNGFSQQSEDEGMYGCFSRKKRKI